MNKDIHIVEMKPRPLAKRARKPQVHRKHRKAGKTTFADKLRSYGLPEWKVQQGRHGLRWLYPFEKGVYWFFFSLFIRNRDVDKYGTCISCGREITVDTSDCGHFIPAGQCGRDLLFDERNNNAECPRCNAWDELHLVGYAKGLDNRYGPGTADSLLQRFHEYKNGPVVKDFKAAEYREKIKQISQRI